MNTAVLGKSIVWSYAVVGAAGLTVLWLLARILNRYLPPSGKSGHGTNLGKKINYEVRSFDVLDKPCLEHLLSDHIKGIEDGLKKAIIVYAVKDGIRGEEARAIYNAVLRMMPETADMDDFFIITTIDGTTNDIVNDKLLIVKFNSIDPELREQLESSSLFKDGFAIIGK